MAPTAVVSVAYLITNRGMGVARFSCVAQCTCAPVEIDAATRTNWYRRLMQDLVNVTASAVCEIDVEILEKSTSSEGGHMFQLLAMMIKTCP